MLATLQPVERPPTPLSPLAPCTSGTPAQPDVLASVGVVLRAERDEEIVPQGEKARHCYRVLSGCVRTVRLLEDGRRQVGEFLFAGDLFGWEALDEYDFALEAVTPAQLHRFPRRNLDELLGNDPSFARRLHAITAAQLRASRERQVLLGRKSASERIASFLLEMAGRMRVERQPAIELPMTRTDMADYLGLTIETVCRGLTQLRQRGTIDVERARVVIRDRRALGVASCGVVH
jgi:CRP/FNR family transcriptional regulator, nitrogen fixation regulation protein